ncbi:HNH endonuclease [Polynucleobacter sp. JS-Mosq-20-D10]|nr:HNH endonuclease [Polynucleobacter sp. JS-Mosq-20-D10]
MPMAQNKECSRGGCHRVVPHGTRYCAEHTQQKNKADYDIYRRDDIGQKLYRTKAWANTRRYHLAEHPFCVECEKEGIYNVENPEVDHVIPLKEWIAQGGDPLDQTNLQTLCLKHHGEKTRRGE